MKYRKLITPLLWISLAAFVLFILQMLLLPVFLSLTGWHPLYPLMASFLLLVTSGVLLLVFTLRSQPPKKHKVFLILTSSSLIGIPVFAILHNLVYALVIKIFGEGFWGNGDEPFFFLLAIIVCPIAYLVGFVGSVVLASKGKAK